MRFNPLGRLRIGWLALAIVAGPCRVPETVAGPAPAQVWTEHAGYRVANLASIGPGRAGFQFLSPELTGIHFTNVLPVTRHYTNQIYLNGSGVAAGDLDGDGWCDLVFGGLGGRTAVYRNLGGGRFEEANRRTEVDFSRLDVTGVAVADLDGDNDLDLVLNTMGQGTHLLENRGDGRLAPFEAMGMVNPGLCGSSSALADVDGDGRLDLYVANYRVITARDEPHLSFTIGQENGRPKATAYGGRPLTDPTLANRFRFSSRPTADGGATVFHDEQGEPDALLHNDGSGRWTRVSWTNGNFLNEAGAPLAEPPLDWGLSVMFRDLNGDLAPDLYVCNDFATPDRVWINDGRGRFRALPTNAIRQISLSTMAVDVADVDRDGFDDIFTADMLSPDRWRRLVQINQANPNMHLFADMTHRPQSPRNMLHRNRGDGTYEEIALMAGLEASEWSWASLFLDVDLDGFEDLLVANGFERDFMNMDAHRRVRAAQARLPRGSPAGPRLAANRLYPRLATPNLAFRNLGNLRFHDASREWGFAVAEVSQGMCVADLDNDGDLDVAINNLNGPATILRNESAAPRLAVRLKGQAPNTRGIGARVEILGGATPRQGQEMIAGGRYLSGDDPMRVFAAGTLTNRLTIEVRWRSGRRSRIADVRANQICEVIEPPGANAPALSVDGTFGQPLFTDASTLLHHAHEQIAVDDFATQPMLPLKRSALGPGVAWADLNSDGWDDLILPGGKGGKMAVFENDERGGFRRQSDPNALTPLPRAQTTAVGWGTKSPHGVSTVFAGLASGSAADRTNGPSIQRYAFGGPNLNNIGPAEGLHFRGGSIGPMALADIEPDGDLDLFVGGNFLPERWPEPASSALYSQKDSGLMAIDAENSNGFARLGLVNATVFTDVDTDGDPDLVVACEWGPIRLFRNEAGRFSETDPPLKFAAGADLPSGVTKLSQLTGWWTGLHVGDFDGDGRLDWVVGNRGRNTAYERFRAHPIRVYYGDFAGDGSVGLLECVVDPGTGKYAPLHDVWTLAKSIPWLLERYDGYEKFARASVEEILGDRFAQARFVEAHWADTTVFLNRGEHFEVRSLPREAQLAPVMAVVVADFDGDGREDVFLGQNFFAVRPEASRHDAGRGLLLRGDGLGGFTAMPARASGLEIYGEQRGAAAADFDRDGRTDLVVAQFNGPTRLLRNAKGQPGVRIRLKGRPDNEPAIGSVVRVGDGTKWGPARELHAGSGYWSQDTACPVLAVSPGSTRLQIRWPGGKTSEVLISEGATEVSATQP